MASRELGPLLRMVRHVPADQLARRAVLQAKRRARVALEKAAPGRIRRPVRAVPRPMDEWPVSPLPPRSTDGLLGNNLDPTPPIDWAPDWAPPDTLARIRLHEQHWLRTLPDADLLAVLHDWILHVPPYGPAYWVSAWNAFALAIRVVTWMDELARRPTLHGEVLQPITDSLARQLDFLQHNLETDLGGNHLIKDILALRWGAACFEGSGPTAWARTADALLAEQLPLQIPDDGLHFERSPAYHLQVFEDLLALHPLLPPGPLRGQLERALERMAYAAAFTTAPDGQPLLLGDGGLTMARPAAELLRVYQAQGGEPPQLPPVAALADAGFYAFRQDSDLVVVDAGPLAHPTLPAHGHADALALTWVLGGRRFLVDQGVYEYQGPTRPTCRSTAAHNTLTLDDHDQAELFGVFRAGRRWQISRHAWMPRADGFVLTASHDGYAHLAGHPVHRRTVEVKGRRIRVEDRVEGGEKQRAVSRLLLHPDVSVRVLGSGAILSRDDVEVDLRTTAAVRAVDAVWWPDFGVERPTTRLELDLGPAPCSVRFTLQARDPQQG